MNSHREAKPESEEEYVPNININVMTLLNLLDTLSISVPDLVAQGQEEKVVADMNVKKDKDAKEQRRKDGEDRWRKRKERMKETKKESMGKLARCGRFDRERGTFLQKFR